MTKEMVTIEIDRRVLERSVEILRERTGFSNCANEIEAALPKPPWVPIMGNRVRLVNSDHRSPGTILGIYAADDKTHAWVKWDDFDAPSTWRVEYLEKG